MHILWVEDDPDDADLFIEIVKAIDDKTQITVAPNGLYALHLVMNEKLEADVILIDINLPIFDGIECLLALRTKYNIATPITVYSTTIRDEVREICVANNADCFTKPTSYREWHSVIAKIIEGVKAKKDVV